MDGDGFDENVVVLDGTAGQTSWQETIDNMTKIAFLKRNELLVEPSGDHPYDWFRMLIDDQFLELIVKETNEYAMEVLSTSSGKERSRISVWKDMTVSELRIFLGLTIHTGTIKLNNLQHYWKTHRLFSTCFGKYMSRDRYLLIMRCLHFHGNIDNHQEITDRLYKVRPLLDYFSQKMKSIYYPGRNLALDESMVLWKGRLIFKQYLPKKRHKYGIKIYMLTESDGTVLDLVIYTGANDVLGGKDHTQKVVLHLMRNYLHSGHSVYMDNFYNSYDLAKSLISQSTFCTGTLRKDRKGSPKDIMQAKLKRGQTMAKYLDGVMIGKWFDKRDVTYISTEFKNEMEVVKNRRGVEKEKPLPIIHYNNNMGGIDRRDQLMAYYPVERKTLRWYKKIGLHIIQLLLINSHILFNKFSGKKMTLQKFRIAVLEKLLPEAPSPLQGRVQLEHIPSKISVTNEKGRTLRKKCRICTSKKLRKDTVYHCLACNDEPGLCLGACFQDYHRK